LRSWRDELCDIRDQLDQFTDNQKVAGDADARVVAKRQEIRSLSELNYRLCAETAQAKLEHTDLLDEPATERLVLELCGPWFAPPVNGGNERRVQEYMAMAICPVCRATRRHSMVLSCGHALCRGGAHGPRERTQSARCTTTETA